MLIFIIAGITISKLITRTTRHSNSSRKQAFLLLAKISNITLIIFGIITALSNIGINVSALIAGLGLTSFGLGFALKDALSNILSGILVLIYRPFKINDTIKIGDVSGTVTNIDLRYITIQTAENRILIPNANLFSATITLPNKETK